MKDSQKSFLQTILKDEKQMLLRKPQFNPVRVVHLSAEFEICEFTHSNPKWVHYLETSVERKPFVAYGDVDYFKQKSRNGDEISAETPWKIGMQDQRDGFVHILTNDFKNLWVLYHLPNAKSPEILGRLKMSPMFIWANQTFQSFGHDLAESVVCQSDERTL